MKMPEPDARVLARRDEIVAALRAIVPGEGVIASAEEVQAYETDGLTAYRQCPLAVVLPVIGEKRVRLLSEGRLLMDSIKFYCIPRHPTELVPVERGLFERSDGRGRVAFLSDEAGEVRYMALSSSPVSVFDAVPWWDRQDLHALVLTFFFVVFAGGLYRVLRRRFDPAGLPRPVRGLLGAVCTLGLAIPAIPLVAVFPLEWECPNLVYGMPWYLRPLTALSYVDGVLTVLVLLGLPFVLRRPEVSTADRRWYGTVAVAAAAYLPYLSFWNLLPPRL